MAAVEEETEIEDGIVTDIWEDNGFKLCITYGGEERITALAADTWVEACSEADQIVNQFKAMVS